MRAVAVLVVILYHFDLAAFSGGFLGVDIFFVLSGYLISRLLLAEKQATGRIDFAGFYARRMRRLFPALLLLIAAVTIAGRFVYAPEAEHGIARDALAALLYAANWSFVVFDQSYFEAFADAWPLRHMWSLAVEEQFYMVWPLVILLLPVARARVRAIAIVIALCAVSAAALALLHDPASPSRAYYGTDARLHEPLIGALAAMAWLSWGDRLAPLVRHLAAPAGALILASIVFLDDQSAAYYRGVSSAFSIATAVLILALEASGAGPVKSALSSKPAVWIGKISYGMYLWHWPIIVALSRGSIGAEVRVVLAFAATLAIAALSYRWVELPIRHARRLFGAPLTPRRTFGLAAAAALMIAVPIALGLRAPAAPDWASDETRVLGHGDFRIAVIGDSVAKSLVPGLEVVAKERGWSVIDGARGGCGIAGGYQVDLKGVPYRWSGRCAKEIPGAFDEIARARPDVVLWYSQTEVNGLLDPRTGTPGYPGSPEHEQMVQSGWEAAAARFGKLPIVVVEILLERSSRRGSARRQRSAARLNELVRAFAGHHPGMHVVSIAGRVCPGGPPCPHELDGIDMRRDGTHYTELGSEIAAREIAARLDQLQLAPRR